MAKILIYQYFTLPAFSVACLGYGRHGTRHGRHIDGGAKTAWQKLKFAACSFFNLYFAPHTTINCIDTTFATKAIIRTSCASTKYCDRTRTLACNVYKTWSSRHATRKASLGRCCCVSGKRMLVRTWLWRVQGWWESDCYAIHYSLAPTDFQIIWNCCGPPLTSRNFFDGH